jgi:hypothetical protein
MNRNLNSKSGIGCPFFGGSVDKGPNAMSNDTGQMELQFGGVGGGFGALPEPGQLVRSLVSAIDYQRKIILTVITSQRPFPVILFALLSDFISMKPQLLIQFRQ